MSQSHFHMIHNSYHIQSHKNLDLKQFENIKKSHKHIKSMFQMHV